MSKTYKKQMIIFLICAFIVMISAIVAGVFLFSDMFKKGDITVRFGEYDNVAHINNKLPIGDEMGKKLKYQANQNSTSYLEFSVKETRGYKTKFEVILKKKELTSEINSNYVKLYLTDMNEKAVAGFESNLIPSYKSLRVDSKSPSEKILYRGEIGALEEQKYKLRVWLSDSSVIETEQKDFQFEVGVKVY